MKKFPLLKSRAILAPMAGITDVAFRAIAKIYGAGMTYTEFVNATALTRNNQKTLDMIKIDPIEKPVGIQLFGTNVEELVASAKIVEKRFDVIDFNCGCPASKVIKIGAGSAMLASPKKIGEIIEALVASVKKPVTIKIRTGIDKVNALEVAKIAEKAGASAITVHGRTQEQGYSGNADWKLIKKVKETLSIPVIGNGDVFSPEQFKQRLEESKVDYIMIGRGALGNPFIFKQINDYLKTGTYEKKNNLKIIEDYIKKAIENNLKFLQIRSSIMNFTKGMAHSSKIRQELSQLKTMRELLLYCKKMNPVSAI